jgi:hypothetical protein
LNCNVDTIRLGQSTVHWCSLVNTVMKVPDSEVARSLTSPMTVRTEYGFFYMNLINLQLLLTSDPSFLWGNSPNRS